MQPGRALGRGVSAAQAVWCIFRKGRSRRTACRLMPRPSPFWSGMLGRIIGRPISLDLRRTAELMHRFRGSCAGASEIPVIGGGVAVQWVGIDFQYFDHAVTLAQFDDVNTPHSADRAAPQKRPYCTESGACEKRPHDCIPHLPFLRRSGFHCRSMKVVLRKRNSRYTDNPRMYTGTRARWKTTHTEQLDDVPCIPFTDSGRVGARAHSGLRPDPSAVPVEGRERLPARAASDCLHPRSSTTASTRGRMGSSSSPTRCCARTARSPRWSS
jgi:hypothetical protein